MDLKRKLARLQPAGLAPATVAAPAPAPAFATDKQERIARMRAVIEQMQARDRAAMRAAGPRAPRGPSALPGETVETGDGPLHRIAQYLEPGHCHGRIPIARALHACPRAVSALALDPALASIDLRRMLLIDTETTGLSGGTGTLPFLIGMAWFEDESLVVEQLFLRTPGEERPMLARLAERLAWSSCIVSYNGKAFDWPLLRTRAIMNRVAVPAPAAHLDLLHCARRVFARRLGQVRLVQIESEVLGMRRERDVDGAEIPELYWQYVRGREGSSMGPVIEHNANDLVALAALLATLVERWQDALPAHDPADRLGIAKVALRHGDLERARRFADAAVSGGAGSDVAVDALLVATEAESKRARHDEVTSLLHDALAISRGSSSGNERAAAIHLALAKHLEHKERDPERALAHAPETARIEGDAACARRVARLTKKRERRIEKEATKKAKQAERDAKRARRRSPRGPEQEGERAADATATLRLLPS